MRNIVVGFLAVSLCGTLLLSSGRGSESGPVGKQVEQQATDLEKQLQAIDTLGAQGVKAAGQAPRLTAMLKNKSAVVRAHAARALGRIGAKEAAPALVAVMSDPDPLVVREAIDALIAIKPGQKVAFEQLTKLLKSSKPEVQSRIIAAMVAAHQQGVPGLVETLKDDDVAYWACIVAGEIGANAAPAVPGLIARIADKRPEVSHEAVIALGKIAGPAKEAVPALTKALGNPDLALAATYALGRIGPAAKVAEAKVKKQSEGSDAFLRTVSLWCLARMNPDDKALAEKVLPLIAESLRSDNPRMRIAAGRALMDLQLDPKVLIPVLQKVMKGADEAAGSEVLDILAQSGEASLPLFIAGLDIPKARAKAANRLARLGPVAKPAVGRLVALLKDPDEEVRREVLFALAEIGPEAKSAVPSLIPLVADPENPIRYGAVNALGSIGPAAADAKPALEKALGSKDEILTILAATALAHVSPKDSQTATKILPLLVKAMGHSEPLVRIEAAGALKVLGPQAKSAAKVLKQAARDEDPRVRQAASEALETIEQ